MDKIVTADSKSSLTASYIVDQVDAIALKMKISGLLSSPFSPPYIKTLYAFKTEVL